MSLIEVNQAILAWTELSKSANLGGIFSLKDLDTIYLFIWFTIFLSWRLLLCLYCLAIQQLYNQTYGSRVKVADFYKVSSWAEHINFDFA